MSLYNNLSMIERYLVTLKMPRSFSREDLSPFDLYILVIAVSLNGLGISVSALDLFAMASILLNKSPPIIFGLKSSF